MVSIFVIITGFVFTMPWITDNMSYLGDTKDGIPVYINKLAIEADFLIGVGIVEIHPWAGFAGGPKIICPGVAGKKTINYTHSLPVTHENVEIGVTNGNPFWENILEASKMAGLDMIINVVLNNHGDVCAVFSGEAETVQKECIKVFKSFNQINFDEPADIVITTSDPKYQYWGQAAIAGYNASRVVRDNGMRIIISDCPEGFGDSQQEIIFYFDSLRDEWDDLDEYWQEKKGIECDNSRNTCAVHRHLKLLRKSEMIMVTKGFPSSTPPMRSQKVVQTVEQAVELALQAYGENAKVIVYDMGAMVLPTVL
jgi:nickel-dependent lactate racemase